MSQYATAAQFYSLGLRQDGVPSGADVNLALQACSGMVDSAAAASGRFTAPFTVWTADITLNVCKLAAYEILSTEGFNPDTNSLDRTVLERWKQASQWLEMLRAGKLALPGVTDSSNPSEDVTAGVAEPVVDSTDPRGWGFGSVESVDDYDAW
jgi:phage gp36-like protein